MAKSKCVKQKLQDGTYEDVFFAANGENVDMSNGYNLEEIIGSVDVANKGDLQTQLTKLKDETIGLWTLVDSWS